MPDDRVNEPDTRAGERTPDSPLAETAPDMPAAPYASWLLGQKVELPDPVHGYVRRRALESRCSPVSRRLTVLHAPGGFGKTALLAHCCRRLRSDGVAVAWLSVDEEDGAVTLATYLSLAFEQAGVNPPDTSAGDPEREAAYVPQAAADSAADYRINLLLHAIRRHREPFVLALDELERLRDPDAIAALNALLERAPGNLHLAMAYRERPDGLALAMLALEGHATTFTGEDLRFSAAHIARFFVPSLSRTERLSRAELESIAADSAGWPIALRLYRNALKTGAPLSDLGASDTVAAWIESRLWRGLSPKDRDFVLDIALFDWIDAALIDEATQHAQSRLRLASMHALNGLLQTAGGEGSAMRLHPLIREYCAARLFRQDPERFRSIHVGIARALARRGQVLDALRHAAEGGDFGLVGAIAEQAGGVKLWIRGGTDVLWALDRWLTEEVLADRPRLALVRCIALIAAGDIGGARRVYQAAAVESVGFTRDAGGQEDDELRTDHLLALGMFAILGCSPLSQYEPLFGAATGFASHPDLDHLLRAVFRLGKSIVHNEMAQFDEAVHWADSALADAGSGAVYVLPYIHFQSGISAMARGRAEEAERHYELGFNVAQGHVGDTGMVMFGKLLRAELELERRAGAPSLAFVPVSVRLLGRYAAWFDVYAASIGVASELAWLHGNRDRAMQAIEQARRFAHATDRAALVRLTSAQRVSLLLLGGDTDRAARAWHSDELPDQSAACLDLSTQRWREMEAVACARLRLLIAQGDFDAARSLALGLREAAARHDLRRTLMRALALSVRLEMEAEDEEGAMTHLVEALRLYRRADYARPLARESEAVLPLLERLLGTGKPGPDAAATREVHAALTARHAAEPVAPGLCSPREMQVLRRLASHTDKAIAGELGISYDGVRYYVRKIFARVQARNRFEAVHRARAMGLLPGDHSDPER